MRYRSAILVPGRKRPWWELSGDEKTLLSAVVDFAGATVASNSGLSAAPHSEQNLLASELSAEHDGQEIIGGGLYHRILPKSVFGSGIEAAAVVLDLMTRYGNDREQFLRA